MLKSELRQQSLAYLRSLSVAERAEGSARIVAQLLEWPRFQQARCILLCAPLPNEPDLLALLEMEFAVGKQFCFPKVVGKTLELYHVTNADQLVATTSRIREPGATRCREMESSEIELALIPGLAFCPSSGLRLGRGGGYFDRFLAREDFQGFPAGVCFEGQLLPALPAEAHDVPMQAVVYPSGVWE